VERELVTESAEVARLATIKDEAVRRSAALNEFLARLRASADG
jgi:hypothetical protein